MEVNVKILVMSNGIRTYL